MRILLISDVYLPRINGVSSSIRTFRRELQRLGHELWLIAPDYGAPAEDEGWIFRVPARVVPFDPEDRWMSRRALLRLLPGLARLRPDLVHIQTPFVAHYAGLRLARALGVPALLSYHTYFEAYLRHYVPWVPPSWLAGLVRRLSRRQCGQVDGVVVPTNAFAEVLRGYGVEGELRVIPTGIDRERFHSGDGGRFRDAQGIAAGRRILLFVGRLAFEKNIGFLLEVMALLARRHPDLLLVLAGEGPAQPHLARQAEVLEIVGQVRFVGNLHDPQALADAYCSAELFLFASRTETQGLVLLEAMSLGVPVVSTRQLGTRDVLQPASGALVVPEETAAFAAAVCRLLDDAGQRRRLGDQGRDYVGEWTAEALARRMAGFYAEVLARREAAALPWREASEAER
jgi:1,2-diacylglycerol 3-alpha-glucosyltransferase